MANPLKGKFFLLALLFLVCSPPYIQFLVSSSSVVPIQNDDKKQGRTTSDVNLRQQDMILDKLDELLTKLSDVVARLESRMHESSRDDEQRREGVRSLLKEGDKVVKKDNNDRTVIKDAGDDYKVRDVEKGKSFSITKFSHFWTERFQFVSAVKLESTPTCINILPFRDHEGFSKYVALGDDKGRVFVLLRNGDVLVEFNSMSESPVMAIVSYMSVHKNESVLVTGHQDGAILMHRVHEKVSGEDWSSLVMESVGKLGIDESGEEGLAVSILEVHHVGRVRYILAVDVSGKIRVYKEDGKVHGSAFLSSKPVAFLKQRLLFLTETGAGSLDLRTMKVRESECEGLNQSRALNYAFDTTERSKAYGVTQDGDLIHVLLLGDVMNFKCRVRSKRRFEVDEPLAIQVIKGYLLVINEKKVFVYNVSTQHYMRSAGPRPIFSAGLDEIRSSFLIFQKMDANAELDSESANSVPLIASDRDRLIVLGLRGGYVGMYRSKLPIYKVESNVMLWTSPVFFFVLFLIGAWHFFAKKKEALTSWGPDDPFSSSSPTSGAPVASSTGDRPFAVDSSSRSSDIMDLRSGSGLRGGPTRRYASPSRYPGGTPGSFRPGSTDPTARPPVDPNYRAGSELKFRGSTLESTGFPKRRGEGMYANNQGVDDNN